MKCIKRYLISILLLSAAAGAFAIDIEYGGLATSTLSAEGDSIEASCKTNLNTKAKQDLTGWIKFPITKDEKLSFAGQGSITTEYIQKYDKDKQTKIGFDLDLFKVTYLEKMSADSACSVSFGRFKYSHLTNVVFSQKNDGVLLRFDASKVKLGLYGGYTGLLNQQNVKILNEDGDNYRKIDEDLKWYEHLYEWADPYVTTSFVMSFPYLFLNQTVAFEISSFFGTKGPAYERALEYNRYYATLSFSGPLAPKLSYALATTMFTEKFNHLGNLTQLSFTYNTGFKNASISLNGVYASGNGNGPFSRFLAFTSSSATYALDAPEYSGLMKIGTSVALKPLPCLYTSIGTDVVFFCKERFIDDHDGWQWYAAAKLQCTNDFSITLSEFRYYSNDSVRDNGGATLKVALAF